MDIFGSNDDSESTPENGEDDEENPMWDGPVPEECKLWYDEYICPATRITIETGAGVNDLETLVSGYYWSGDRLTLKRPVRIRPEMSYERETHDFHLECNLSDAPFITMDMSEYGDVHYTQEDFVIFQAVVMVDHSTDYPQIQKWRTAAAFTNSVAEERLATKEEQMEFLEEFGSSETDE